MCRAASAATSARPPRAFDGLIHRPPGGGLIIELERAGPSVDLSRHLEHGLQTIIAAASLRGLCDETARIFKELTGYDRVMVYRFDDQGHGEVLSEEREPELEAFLGNRYPASDIPQIARRLYERNRVRVLVDVEYAPVPLTPRLSPISGEELDMSLCFLRSSSPIHVQYLKNMGVRGHAGGVADGQRQAVGAGVLPPLRPALRPFRGTARSANCWPRRWRPGSPRWKASRRRRPSCRCAGWNSG